MADAPYIKPTPGMTTTRLKCVVCGVEWDRSYPAPGHPHSEQEWVDWCTANNKPHNAPRFVQVNPPPLPDLPDGTKMSRREF